MASYIKTIVADLIDWSRPGPTGAIVYNSNGDVVDSSYCDDIKEYSEFFNASREDIDSDTELIFKTNSEDFGNPELQKLMSEIKDAFWRAKY